MKLALFRAGIVTFHLSFRLVLGAAAPSQQAFLQGWRLSPIDSLQSIAISGNTIVIGMPGDDSNATGVDGITTDYFQSQSGAAYVFVRVGSNWTQQAYLKAADPRVEDRFGFSVAISGDTIVIGAYSDSSTGVGNDTEQGAAYVFVRNGTNWTQQAVLRASNGETGIPYGDWFGYSVAISGDVVVVGAPNEDSNAAGVNGNEANNSANGAGAAYVFVRNETNWAQQAYLKASNTDQGDRFGGSVAVSGETVVVGAQFEDSNAAGVNGDSDNNGADASGAAYVFVRNGNTWTQQAYLKASNPDAADFFGWSVAVSGDTIVVGSVIEDGSATGVNGPQTNGAMVDSGAAYVFVRSGTNWFQQAYLKASNTGTNDAFGYSVAVWGDTAVVSAVNESSSATGINGNQADDGARNSGATYVFVRNGTNWVQQAYLKASNSSSNFQFGYAAAISADTVVAASPFVPGAYVFTGFGQGPRLTIVRDGNGGYFIRCNAVAQITYALERASDVTGPWNTLTTTNSLTSTVIEFHDTNAPPGQSFYRVALK